MSNNKTAVHNYPWWVTTQAHIQIPEYGNGCDFCANTLAYANGFVQHIFLQI